MQSDVICRDFAQRLRKLTLQDVYIIVNDDVTPQLKKYMRLLTEIKFEESCYNAYYGAVKKIIGSFVNFYSITVDNVIRDADKYANVVDRAEILALTERTINLHMEQQVSFGKDYLPVQSAEEKQIYEEIQDMYNDFIERFLEFKESLNKLDKQNKAEAFAQEHYKLAVQKTSEIFDFAHTYIGMILADRIKEIRISLEEILLRIRNNLRKIGDESEQSMNDLMNILYDQNKELMTLCRQFQRSAVEIAEVSRSIEKTREKMEVSKYDVTQARLEEEVEFWTNKLHDFNEVANLLEKLSEEKDIVEQEKVKYAGRTCTELPGSRLDCWRKIGANLNERSVLLKDKIIEAGKALVTFFGVKGADRIFYENDHGRYFIDEYNHQVYVEDFGLKVYHVNCKGERIEVPDSELYYYDEFGRFIKNKDNEKIHQVAPCTSHYKLNDDHMLGKVTKDCGHSEAVNRKCKMRIKDPGDVEVLPDTEEIDISRTLTPEEVKYLWDTFGHILPHALHDICHEHSKNPIQHLAHKLLHHKHDVTRTEINERKKVAEEYRANVLNERHLKQAAESAAWKAKQVKRRKPEESDNLTDRLIYEAQLANEDFVKSLNFYD